jgi:adenylosuccinate synthase
LATEYDALVRVGGPNAGHSVYSEPDPHVFHLLPSGTSRAPHSKLLIGPGAVLNLEVLKREITKYRIDTSRLVIDENATMITNDDIQNECLLKENIGSTAQGVGSATAANIMNRCETNKCKAKHHDPELKGYLGSVHEELEKIFTAGKRVLVEGTQGTFLSLHHGFYPHVTSRDTTASGCLAETGISPRRVRKIVLVTRTYPIRVGNPENGTSGPFFSNELTWKEIAKRSGIKEAELVRKEKTTTTKRDRRVAEFSWTLFRRACELNSPTDIALTFVDYLSIKNRDARRVEQLTPGTIEFVEELERCSAVSVSLISTRFDYRAVIDRRQWKRIIYEYK